MRCLGYIVLVNAVSKVRAITQVDRSTKIELNPVHNANHIFNAVRGAMRQWDSSWNHNGMTFFRATVPEGVQLYHGTHTDKAIEGMEWLAFEPEHALGFARPRMRPPPGAEPPHHQLKQASKELEWLYEGDEEDSTAFLEGLPVLDKVKGRKERQPSPPPPPPPPPHSRPEPPRDRPHHRSRPRPPPCDCYGPNCHDPNGRIPHPLPPPPPSYHRGRPDGPGCGNQEEEPHFLNSWASSKENNQQMMHLDEPTSPQPPRDSPDGGHGYLHFYKTQHPLELLLIDGMSAGKTGRGTLDSQDYVLLLRNSSTGGESNRSHFAPFMDGYRAEAMCNMSRDAWDNRIDGFIRMEAGFEIILCDFHAHLELVRVQEVAREHNDHGFGGQDSFRFYQAIADRFHGIGGQRVHVDFTNMVSAFSYDIDLFIDDPVIPESVLPRLNNVNQTRLKLLHSDITDMVLKPRKHSTIDWQAIAGMVVQHFANPLKQLESPESTPGEEFKSTLTTLLQPLISDGNPDTDVVVQRCVDQFVHSSYGNTQAGQVVHNVTHHICFELVTRLHAISGSDTEVAQDDESVSVLKARQTITNLISYLAWPTWKECSPGCGPSEVCVLPIWPLTSKIEDRKQPRCKNATEFEGENGPGGPGRRGDKNYWYDGSDDSRGPDRPNLRRATR